MTEDKEKAAVTGNQAASQQNQKHGDYSADPLRMWFSLAAGVKSRKKARRHHGRR
jgi:hypothetical protein